MIIQVKDLKEKNGRTSSYFFQESLQNLEDEEMLMYHENKENPVNVKVNAYYQDSKVYISGNLKTWITVECSRCLASFSQEVEGDFWEEFQVHPSTEEEFNEEGEEDDYYLSREAADKLAIKGNVLDLREYIRQLFIVFQEWKPLCSNDCRGICSDCGQNLNEDSCSCTHEDIDPRLAPLQKLKSGKKLRRN